jgi:uncharacterized FlaG/YvyC family protein
MTEIPASGQWPNNIDQKILELLRIARTQLQENRKEHKTEIKRCTEAQSQLEVSKIAAKKNLASINGDIKDINTKIRFELDKMEEDD